MPNKKINFSLKRKSTKQQFKYLNQQTYRKSQITYLLVTIQFNILHIDPFVNQLITQSNQKDKSNQQIKSNSIKKQYLSNGQQTKMMEVKYMNSLLQSKQSILHTIQQLSETIKNNQQKQFAQSLSNVLSSIATFDEDYIKGSTSIYSNNIQIQQKIDMIIAKIKSSQQLKTQQTDLNKSKVQQQSATLKTTSEIVRSSSTQKQPRQKSSSAKKDSSSGLFGVFGKILGGKKQEKPKAYQMILPQKQSKAIYDPVKKKWIFQGEEQQPQKQIPKPPPKKQTLKSDVASQQGLPKQVKVKKNISEIDDLTAPPSFKRRGQTKSVGGGKRAIIKQEIIPTTLVMDSNNPFDSLINMIDKEFYKLQEEREQLETAWVNQKEKELKNGLNSSRLKESRNLSLGLCQKDKFVLSENQKNVLESLNVQIVEFNRTSSQLLDDYLKIKQLDKQNNINIYQFDTELNQKLIKVAKDNSIISHQLSNSNKEKFQKLKIQTTALKQQNDQDYTVYHPSQQRKPIQVMVFEHQPLLEQAQTTASELDGLRFDMNLLKQQLVQKDRQITELRYRIEEYEQNMGEEGKVAMNLSGKFGLIGELGTTLQALEKNASRLQQGLHMTEAQHGEFNQQLHELSSQLRARDEQIIELSELVKRLQNVQQAPQDKDSDTNFGEDISCQLTHLQSELKLKDNLINQLQLELDNQSLAFQLARKDQAELVQQKTRLVQENEELDKMNEKLKGENAKLQQERKSSQLHTRHHHIIQEEMLKSNLHQLEAFAHSVAEQSALLMSIHAKQAQLQTYRASSDRSSQSSEKKSTMSNENDDLQIIQQKNDSFLNISDILTEMTKQYMEKMIEMNYHYHELEQANKSLGKELVKERQKTGAEIECLRKSLVTAQMLNEGYKKSRKELEQKILWYETDCEKLRKKLQHMKKQQTTNRELFEQALYDKHNHNHSLSILQNNNEELEFKIQSLEDDMKLKMSEIEERVNEIEGLRVELEEKEGQIKEKDGVVNRLRSKIAQDSEHYQSLIHTKEVETKSMVRTKQRELDTAGKEIESLLDRIEKLQRQSKSTKEHLTLKLQQAQSARKDIHKQLKSKDYQLSELTSGMEVKEREMDRLRHANAEVMEKVQELEATSHKQKLEIQQLKSEVHSITQENAEQIMVIESINAEKETLQSHSQTMQAQLSSLSLQLESTRNELSRVDQNSQYVLQLENANLSLTEENRNLSSQLNYFTGNQQYYQEIYDSINNLLQTVKREKMEVQNTLEETIAKYADIGKDFAQMRQAMDAKITYLTQELENSFTSGEQLSNQLAQYSQLVHKMDEKMTSLESELLHRTSTTSLSPQQLQEKHSQQIAEVLQLLDVREKQLQALTHSYSCLKQAHADSIAQTAHDSKQTQSQLQQEHRQLTANYAQLYKMHEDEQAKHEASERVIGDIQYGLYTILNDRIGMDRRPSFLVNYEQYLNEKNNRDRSNSQIQAERLFIQQMVNEVEKMIDSLGERLSDSLQQEEIAQQVITELESQTEVSNAHIKELQAQIVAQQSLQSHKEMLQNRIKESTQQQSKQLQVTNTELLFMVETLQQQTQRQAVENSQLLSELKSKSSQLSLLNQRINSKEQDEEDKIPKQQFDDLVTQYEELVNQLQQTKDKLVEFEKTKNQKEILEEENYQLKEEKSNLLRGRSLQNLDNLEKAQNQGLLNLQNFDTVIGSQHPYPPQNQPPYQTNLDRSPQTFEDEQLNEIVIELSKRLETTEQQNSRITAELDSFKEQLFQQKQLTHSLKEKSNQTDLILETLTQENEKKDAALKEKRDAVNVKDTIISELSVSLQCKTQQLKKCEEDKSALESHIQSNKVSKAAKQQQEDQSEGIQVRHDNLTEIEELLASLNQELEEKKVQQTELMQVISQQQSQISMLRQKIKQMETHTKDIQPFDNQGVPSTKQLNQADKQEEQQSQQLYMVIQQMQNEIELKNKKVEQLNNILDSLNENMNKTVDEQAVVDNQHYIQKESKCTEVEDNLARLVQEIAEKNNQIENQIMYAQILKEKEEQLSFKNSQLEKANNQLENHIKALEVHLQSLQHQIQSIQSQQDKGRTLSQMKDQQQKIEELQILLGNMQEEISFKEEQQLLKSNEIHRLKQCEVEHMNEIQRLKDENERLSVDINQLYDVVESTNTEVKELKDERQKLEETIGSLKQQHVTQKNTSSDNVEQRQNQEVKSLIQQISKLQGEVKLQRQRVTKKEDEIEQMNELITSQALDIEQLEDKIRKLDETLLETAEKYQHKLKTEIVAEQLNIVNEQISKAVQRVDGVTKMNESKQQDNLSAVKVELQQTYEQLRNKKIEADELRQNLFDVNKMYTERQAKYELKLRTLQTEIHKYGKHKDAFIKYENNIKELEIEVSALTHEKTEFLRVIERLEKQLLKSDKRGNDSAAEPDTRRNEPKREPGTDQKLKTTRSEIVEPATEVKPTGFFGSISSLFMTPQETERIAKKIINK